MLARFQGAIDASWSVMARCVSPRAAAPEHSGGEASESKDAGRMAMQIDEGLTGASAKRPTTERDPGHPGRWAAGAPAAAISPKVAGGEGRFRRPAMASDRLDE